MIRRTKFIVACLLACVMAGAGAARAQPASVIVFIGDGMGPEQVAAAGLFATGTAGTLSFEAFAHQGRITTHSADAAVTDSAAAGTALATGVKVDNSVIRTASPGDGAELPTLLERAAAAGKSTGLVTTTYMTHATPAAFGAHDPSRSNTAGIAADYLAQTRPNVLLGGGANGLTIGAAAAAGYAVVTDRAEMLAIDTETATHVSGQFGSTHLPYEYDGLGALPHLSEMTATALAILDGDPDGFFLMVEGGRIDHAGHDNDIERNVRETVEFAHAVTEAVNWAAGRTDTLIVVTADHETGGLTVLAGSGAGSAPAVTWSTGLHTGVPVAIYAWGVNAKLVGGLMDNTDLQAVATAADPTGGDANLDGNIDVSDLAILANHYGGSEKGWLHGDFTGDGAVDVFDLAAMANNYGIAAGGSVHVPEPAVLLCLLAVAPVLAGRRRRSGARARRPCH